VSTFNAYRRAYAFPVRCFANEVTSLPDTVQAFRAFKTTRELPSNKQITLPMYGQFYDFEIDWGDGQGYVPRKPTVANATTAHNTGHTYTTLNEGATVQISIRGSFPRLYCGGNTAHCKPLRSIDQWGDLVRTNMTSAFQGTTGLVIAATDTPNLTNVMSLQQMFDGAVNLTGNFSGWNTSTITNLSYVFRNAVGFNQPLTSWNTSKVKEMSYLFNGATDFNQPLS
jgi:hypothetical protein